MEKSKRTFIYKSNATTSGKDTWSWAAHPEQACEIVEIRGNFIKDKTYMVEQTEDPSKLQVSGFFNITFLTQRWEGKKLKDVLTKGEKPGFWTLYFSVYTCKKYLNFQEILTSKNKINGQKTT